KTEVPATSSSCSSDLASKFIIFLDIPHTDAEIVSPLDVHVHHEVLRTQAPTLLTILVSVITNIPQSSKTFTPPPILTTPNPSPTIETTNPLSTLPDFASCLTSLHLLIKESRDEVTLAKVSSQPYSTYEAASTLTEFELKKILIDKIEKMKRKNKDKDEDHSAGSDRGLKKIKLIKDAEPTIGPKNKDSMFGSSKGTKSQPKSSGKSIQSEEPVFEMSQGMRLPLDVTGSRNLHHLKNPLTLTGPTFKLLKGTRSNFAELEYDFEECYKALSEKLDWENPKGGDYPFDLSKPLPLITHGKCQRVPFEYLINNDLKCIEDKVPNIWSPVKAAYDRYALWGISYWREQRKSLYAYARGIQSRGDVYSTKRILAVTYVKVMRKHRYWYLEEIVVRRADNVLYRFKKGDDVADFAIALRMFTRNLVIQKLVEDLQLGVESYQKKINITKPDTTRPDLRKRHPYTLYKDP
ncbi:hypothetical protein Tco_1433743, partial [Tanacetum coccineum]